MALVASRDLEYLNQLEFGAESLQVPEIEHALATVHTSMVELPDQDEARSVAKLAVTAQVFSLQNRQLTSAVHTLEAQYANLMESHEASLVEHQDSVDQMRSELRRLKDQQAAIGTQVRTLIAERDYALTIERSAQDHQIGARRLGDGASRLERDPEDRPLHASAIGTDFVTNSEAPRSSISESSLSALPPPIFSALQIARGLEDTRREAVRSKREQTFTIDVERRTFRMDSGHEFVKLNPVLNLSLDTARSEVTSEHIGRIRFFPDGSSTGGRIQLQHGKEGATVNIDWSTGAVTVQVPGNWQSDSK